MGPNPKQRLSIPRSRSPNWKTWVWSTELFDSSLRGCQKGPITHQVGAELEDLPFLLAIVPLMGLVSAFPPKIPQSGSLGMPQDLPTIVTSTITMDYQCVLIFGHRTPQEGFSMSASPRASHY